MPAAVIDVIIPAYRGLPQTRRCLESVLGAAVSAAREVIVVDDASPEPDLSAWLRALADAGRVTLIVHAGNAGFVASVNEGMRLHPDRDVVLLNSDTEVADGWLDRLAACAGREPRAGTVTPFSNNATVCSYPRFAAPNALPAGMTTASLDALFARANAGRSVDLPTAVGFCMFIRRACLAQVGPFDEAAFGRGYGEEVDFCLRASQAGWRHLLAADTFVYHEGEVSFGGGATAIRERAQAIIDERHPEFQPRLAEFLKREPARPRRRAVDIERLRAEARPRVLFVSHGWGGGIDKHVQDLAAAIAGDAAVLALRPAGGGIVRLAWLNPAEEFEVFFEEARDWDLLVEVLAALGIGRMHFHHTHGLAEAVLDLPARLGIPYDVTLHDYLSICPQHHLSDEAGRYCGEPDEDGCNACLARRKPAWEHDIAGWRRRFGTLLAGADRIIAPSHDIAGRVHRYHPQAQIKVWPHPEAESEFPAAPVRVLLPGGISAIKGIAVLEACVRDARERDLPLHFRVLGHLERVLPLWPDAPLTVTGGFPDGGIERLDVIFFPSQVPESFSYILTAAMRSGLPIVTTNLGALPERLAGHGAATVLRWDAEAAAFNDALLRAAGRTVPPPERTASA
jgi:GT2 family glycosyltransferase